jgi:hypothetical protein
MATPKNAPSLIDLDFIETKPPQTESKKEKKKEKKEKKEKKGKDGVPKNQTATTGITDLLGAFEGIDPFATQPPPTKKKKKSSKSKLPEDSVLAPQKINGSPSPTKASRN